MSSITSFTFVLVFIAANSFCAELPSFIPHCCREDPKIGECFIKGTENIKQYAKTGYKKYNIPPISPLFVTKIEFAQKTDNLDINVVLRNSTVVGLDTYQFTRLTYDPKTYTFNGQVKIGSLTIKGDIDFQGEVLQVSLTGTGQVVAVSEPTDATFEVKGKVIKKSGIEYFQVVDAKTDITKLDGKLKFENFKADHNEFVDALNDVINSNSRLLIKQVRPSVETLTKKTVVDIFNSLAGTIPYDEALPHCDKQ